MAKRLSTNFGVIAIGIACAVVFALVLRDSWKENVEVSTDGTPLKIGVMVVDPPVPEIEEMNRIASQIGWQKDPDAVRRYDELAKAIDAKSAGNN